MEIEVPVANCPNCKLLGPVIVDELDFNGEDAPPELEGQTVTIIYCTQCDSIINGDRSIEVKYYTQEDLEKLGWKLA